MPYLWTRQTDPAPCPRATLVLWPHRSLPRRGFAVVILAAFTLITIPLYGLIGTVLLWGLLPFVLAAVAALWWGLERSYRDGDIVEELVLTPETAHLSRRNPGGDIQEWRCNAYWAEVEMHRDSGPVPHYITLRGAGREVEIGAFLSEDERKSLYGELRDALLARQNGPA